MGCDGALYKGIGRLVHCTLPLAVCFSCLPDVNSAASNSRTTTGARGLGQLLRTAVPKAKGLYFSGPPDQKDWELSPVPHAHTGTRLGLKLKASDTWTHFCSSLSPFPQVRCTCHQAFCFLSPSSSFSQLFCILSRFYSCCSWQREGGGNSSRVLVAHTWKHNPLNFIPKPQRIASI